MGDYGVFIVGAVLSAVCGSVLFLLLNTFCIGLIYVRNCMRGKSRTEGPANGEDLMRANWSGGTVQPVASEPISPAPPKPRG
jgi:hypothetical protein